MKAPPNLNPFDRNGQPDDAWINWMMEVFRQGKYQGKGLTAERPTDGLNDADWFFDTTLGKPIWYYSSGWIDATGASV